MSNNEHLEDKAQSPDPISHDRAAESALRFINAYFHNPGRTKPQIRIPRDPTDDDAVLMAYINQQRAREVIQHAPRPQLKPLIDWLRNEAEGRMKAALSRRPGSMRDASAGELKDAKRMAEQMAGRKLDLISGTVKENQSYCDMQDRIADKLEREARQLSQWADVLAESIMEPTWEPEKSLQIMVTPRNATRCLGM